MSKYWFRPRKGLFSKDLGWGYAPITWEGKAFIGLFLLLVALMAAIVLTQVKPEIVAGMTFIGLTVLLILVFTLISEIKTKR